MCEQNALPITNEHADPIQRKHRTEPYHRIPTQTGYWQLKWRNVKDRMARHSMCLIVSPSVPARRHPRRPLTVVTRLPA